jgi:hypothetical protein
MIINWNNSESPVFITLAQAEEVLAVLEKHGLFDEHEWVNVGYGIHPEGDDAEFYNNADHKLKDDEFWKEVIWDMKYYVSGGIRYPFDLAHTMNQRQGIKRYLDDVKTINQLKEAINDFGGDLLYDFGYRITKGFFILEAWQFGEETERDRRNDQYETVMGADWKITVDLTKIAPLEE